MVDTYDATPPNPVPSGARIKLLIADERPVIQTGLANMLSTADEFEVLGAAGDEDEILAMTEAHRPDLVLMNLDMPGGAGIVATRAVLAHVPRTRVIGLALSNDERALDGLAAGAVGCLFKDTDENELVGAILAAVWSESRLIGQTARRLWGPRAVDLPGERLTPRQQEILDLVGRGLSNKAIAGRLKISEKTVKSNLTSIFRQLRVDSRTQAALWAVRHGWSSPAAGRHTVSV